jgi:hypothetical protein
MDVGMDGLARNDFGVRRKLCPRLEHVKGRHSEVGTLTVLWKAAEIPT